MYREGVPSVDLAYGGGGGCQWGIIRGCGSTWGWGQLWVGASQRRTALGERGDCRSWINVFCIWPMPRLPQRCIWVACRRLPHFRIIVSSGNARERQGDIEGSVALANFRLAGVMENFDFPVICARFRSFQGFQTVGICGEFWRI